MSLQPMSLRSYLRHHLLGAAVVNGTVTGLLTWWLTKGESIPLWGEKGVAMETILATFGVTVLTVLIATPSVRREMRKGKVEALHWTRTSHGFLRWSPFHTGGRALLFALSTTALFASTAILLWALFGPKEASLAAFFAYKVGYVIAVGSIVTPLNIIWVLSERGGKTCAETPPNTAPSRG